MAFNITKLKKKVDKIISKNNLGSDLTMNVYNVSKDRFGKKTLTLDTTINSFAAKIDTSGRNRTEENFNQESLDLIVPYDLDIYPVNGKLKLFDFMNRTYQAVNIRPIDGIQNSGAAIEVTMRLYEE